MAREIPLQARIDEELYKQLKAEAEKNLRSVSAEAYLRLKQSFAKVKPVMREASMEG